MKKIFVLMRVFVTWFFSSFCYSLSFQEKKKAFIMIWQASCHPFKQRYQGLFEVKELYDKTNHIEKVSVLNTLYDVAFNRSAVENSDDYFYLSNLRPLLSFCGAHKKESQGACMIQASEKGSALD